MSDKETSLLLCIVCEMYGSEDDFTPESYDTCKKCLRVRKLKQTVCGLKEENSVESVMNILESLQVRVSALEETMEQRLSALEETMEIRLSALEETMEIRLSALEEIISHFGDLLEKGQSRKGREDSERGKETTAAHQMTTYVVTLPEALDDIIKTAKSERRRFYIGIAEQHDHNAGDSIFRHDSGGHHVDQEVGNIAPTVYHTRFMKKDNVLTLEDELISEYGGDRLCMNLRLRNDQCIGTEQGIVYIRTY